MSEWGLPDWRDASAYGDIKSWGFNRWRWEFYRRREDIREYFDSNAEKEYQDNLLKVGLDWAPNAHLRPEEAGFLVTVHFAMREKLGYEAIPNPRISAQWDVSIMNIHDLASSIRIQDNKWRSEDGQADTLAYRLEKNGVILTARQKFILKPDLKCQTIKLDLNEVAIVFDLNYPLDGQLRTAIHALNAQYQIAGKETKSRKRRHPKKWLSYLRALDAREAGASWGEMANVFFGDGILDRRKDPAGGYGPPPPQAARDIWEAANALRFNF